MRNIASAGLVLLLSVGYQEPPRHRLYLSDGETMAGVRIVSVTEDSLGTMEGISVDLMHIDRIELMLSGSDAEAEPSGCGPGGTAIAGGILGCVVGLGSARDCHDVEGMVAVGTLVGAGAGGIVGAAMACRTSQTLSVSLTRLPRLQRYREIRQYLRNIEFDRRAREQNTESTGDE